MSVAGGILTDVLSKVGTLLGSSFSELPDLFSTDNTPTHELDNGYSAILLDGDNSQNQVTGYHTISRRLQIKISYRTYSRPDGTNTKTSLATLYTNEEAIINHIVAYPSKPTGLLGVVDPVETFVETMDGKDDKFLINTLTFSLRYRFAMT